MAARMASRRPVLLGRAEPEAVRVWDALSRCGRARVDDLAGCFEGDAGTCLRWLARLEARRLVRDAGGVFESLFVSLVAGGGDDDPAPPAGPTGVDPVSPPA